MQAARRAAAHWPDEAVHLEYFAPPADAGGDEASEPFTLQLARRGLRVEVAAGQSAVQALHELGIELPTSCEQGLCGTCVVGWRDGEPEHRDFCLTATERRSKVALCCSRAKSRVLTVEL
jgi:vanillate O-demethylase ferredoxin subunit